MTRGILLSADISSIEMITESPYKCNASAEVGEYLFEYTQSLMDPEQGLGSSFRTRNKSPSKEAVEVFGKQRAKVISRTAHLISTSGILYGCDWSEGFIQGQNCGVLETDLLLMCLQDNRIARSSVQMLKVIIKDLNLSNIVRDALCRWKLKSKYPHLIRCKDAALFRQNQARFFQCIFFIARAATCMKILEWDFIGITEDSSLKRKIHACLTISENMVAGYRHGKKSFETDQVKKVTDGIDIVLEPRKKSKMNLPESNTPYSSKLGNDVGANDSVMNSASMNTNQERGDSHNPILNGKNKSFVIITNPTQQHGVGRKSNNASLPEKCRNDLYHRLRSKDYKIVSISISGNGNQKGRKSSTTISIPSFGRGEKEQKISYTTTEQPSQPHLRRFVSDEHSSRDIRVDLKSSKRKSGRQSGNSIPTKKGPNFSHALFGPQNNARKKKSECSVVTASNNVALTSESTANKAPAVPSHALLDKANNLSRKQIGADNRINVTNRLELTASNAEPCYVSDSTASKVASTDPNYWYPVDPQEIILNPIEIETAWLVEESMYCCRSATADWVFMMKYASPTLQIALRCQATGDNDDEILAKIVHSEIAAKRFNMVRKIVRRKLLKNVVRPRMSDVVPRLRKASHPLRKKNDLKLAA
mmetsp:Transcript_17180/g.47296  ORF Transcript_17180/g.47296 Transcript_17180/m.47296 type:complete len:648 (-) Transcript_17180:244-2187(-)|eukprot:CAMPEP_0172374534 /NCGR_PEP_ID=MMETSP1060-20121228/56076_1 /TAXON_ID=37318 /ORGANISM="Pseudo-nitzschia pungens, Strain cf. cingulata" /LENGTH=647 /DNA_ID=CAMNT_0013101235 /DNA_START=157 /DNA_END=2100 /DNA_ORIENTATION=-